MSLTKQISTIGKIEMPAGAQRVQLAFYAQNSCAGKRTQHSSEPHNEFKSDPHQSI